MLICQTIARKSEASLEIKKSRFLAHTAPVTDEEAARSFIHQQQKKFFDARHNPYAYVLGKNGDKQKSNDDGEPGGTAGSPIINAIRQNGLTDVVIVVTRYFGGIKLGAGGLTRAYGQAALAALADSGRIKRILYTRLACTTDYATAASVEQELRRLDIRQEAAEYADKVTFHLLAEKEEADAISASLTDAASGRCRLTAEGECCLDLPCKS